jgi:hypothetical protein
MNRRAELVIALALLATTRVDAREVDQFTDRAFQREHLTDASAILDARMNAILTSIVADLNAKRPSTQRERDDIIYDAFQGSRIELVAQIRSPFEAWVREDAPVTLFSVDARGIYGGDVDYDDMGLAYYIEIAPVLRLGSVLVGLDKLGHFFGQGWFYYREYKRLHDRDPRATENDLLRGVRKYGHDLEASYLGLTSTGVYAYADLAANWSGLSFYLALFSGPDPYVVVANGTYRQARTFHFADYVTDAWDEAINPSRPRTPRFFDKVARYLRAHVCAAYRADPGGFLGASGHTQDPSDYLWDGAVDAVFDSKRRFALAEICR